MARRLVLWLTIAFWTIISVTNTAGAVGTIFDVVNGQIVAPNGSIFIAKGINVEDWAAVGNGGVGSIGNGTNQGTLVPQLFPGVNFVRLNAEYGGGGTVALDPGSNDYNDSPAALSTFIQNMTSQGIVVEIEDHNTSNAVLTGTALQNELQWYKDMASYYSSNPDVWFGTINEPWGNPTSAVLQQEQDIYNAIRSTGNNNMVLMEISNPPDAYTTDWNNQGSYFANMTNVAWDVHLYDIGGTTAQSQSQVNAEVASDIAAVQTGTNINSANGVMPVIVGEYGPSITGNGTDVNGTATVTGVEQSGFGSAAWSWGGTASDTLQNDGVLTSYGQQVANWMLTFGAAAPTAITINTGTSAGYTMPSSVYGIAAANMACCTNNGYTATSNTAYQATVASLNLTLLRHNWDGSNFNLIFQTRASAPNAGDYSSLQPYFQNAAKFIPANAKIVVDMSAWPSWINTGSSSDWTLLGQMAVAVAQQFAAAGLPVTYWEVFNEQNSDTPASSCDPTVTFQIGMFNAVQSALKAYNSSIQVGGLTDTYYDGVRFQCFIQNATPDFVVWHNYAASTSQSNATAFANMIGYGNSVTAAKSVMSSYGKNAPIFLGEYNVNGDYTTPDARNTNYVSAIAGALYLSNGVKAGQGSVFGAAYWEINFASDYGIIQPSSDTASSYTINSPGYWLQYGASHMGGTVVTTTGTIPANLDIIATVNGSSYAVQLTNYGTTPINLNLTGLGPSSTWYEVSQGNPNGYTQTISASQLTNFNVPQSAVLFLTGSAETLAINTIATQTAGSPFVVSGTIAGVSSAPTLQYSTNGGGTWTNLPSGATVTATTFTYTNPALTATASAQVSVRDANTTTVIANSNTFTVSSQSSGPPGIASPANLIAYFKNIAGSHIVSGQFTGTANVGGAYGGITPINNIASTSGQYLGMIGCAAWNGTTFDSSCTGYAIPYWQAGGLITVTASVPNPTTGGPSTDTSSLNAAQLLTSGTATNNALNASLNSLAGMLKTLQTAGVVVILQPFGDSNTTSYWWGTGASGTGGLLTPTQFIALWKYTYTYLVTTNGLTNLVWDFGVMGTGAGTGDTTNYPGAANVDTVSYEAYSDTPGSAYSGDYSAMNALGLPLGLWAFGPGTVSAGDTGFDERVLVSQVQTYAPNAVFFQQQWSYNPTSGSAGWGMDTLVNTADLSSALANPYVVNRGQIVYNGSGGAAVAWNPGTTSSNINLTNSNLTATFASAVFGTTLTNQSWTTGKYCWDTQITAVSPYWAVGMANASMALSPPAYQGLGSTANGYAFYVASATNPQSLYYNGVAVLAGQGPGSPSPTGDIVTQCVDFGAGLVWVTDTTMRNLGDAWNNSVTATPATETGGASISGLTCPCFPAFNARESGASATLNGKGPLAVGLPSGFAYLQAAGTGAIHHPVFINLGGNDIRYWPWYEDMSVAIGG